MLLKERVQEAIDAEWGDSLIDMVDRYSFKIEITIRNRETGSIAERVVNIP